MNSFDIVSLALLVVPAVLGGALGFWLSTRPQVAQPPRKEPTL